MYEDKFKLRKRIQEDYNKDDILLTIGIELDEVDKEVMQEIFLKWKEDAYTDLKLEEFKKAIKEDDPVFYKKMINNIPYQRAYLYGHLWHNHPDPHAYLNSMHVKKQYRHRGYATEMLEDILKDIDDICYPAFGRIVTNEKPDDFIWDFTGGKTSDPMYGRYGEYTYGMDLSVEEFNKRQEKLLNFYEKFGFKAIETITEYDGKKEYIIKRPNQCKL